jgi:hypothetical protein
VVCTPIADLHIFSNTDIIYVNFLENEFEMGCVPSAHL